MAADATKAGLRVELDIPSGESCDLEDGGSGLEHGDVLGLLIVTSVNGTVQPGGFGSSWGTGVHAGPASSNQAPQQPGLVPWSFGGSSTLDGPQRDTVTLFVQGLTPADIDAGLNLNCTRGATFHVWTAGEAYGFGPGSFPDGAGANAAVFTSDPAVSVETAQLHLTHPRVLVSAGGRFYFAGTATLGLATPTGSASWDFGADAAGGMPNYELEGGPGDYGLTFRQASADYGGEGIGIAVLGLDLAAAGGPQA